MCYPTKCGSCGKTTWGGCGRHVASVYRQIPDDKRCACRDWPGVSLTAEGALMEQPSSSLCAVL